MPEPVVGARPVEVDIRKWSEGDLGGVVALVRASRGLTDPDEFGEEYLRWKHFENPFGASPGWVAVDGDKIVGLRTFLRWELDWAGRRVAAARAVDTSVHPDWQRRGLFSRLTTLAVESLTADGVSLIFNTPNDKSRPGYLKMGWDVVGALPLAIRPRNLRSAARVIKARAPALRASVATTVGLPAVAALSGSQGVAELLASQPEVVPVRTRRTAAYLAWRYGYEPLGYRVMLAGGTAADGLAVFRVRRRGAATEASVCEVIMPPTGRGAGAARLVRRVLRGTGADYAALLSRSPLRTHLVPMPGQGPLLVCRVLSGDRPARLDDWDLTLGDIELL